MDDEDDSVSTRRALCRVVKAVTSTKKPDITFQGLVNAANQLSTGKSVTIWSDLKRHWLRGTDVITSDDIESLIDGDFMVDVDKAAASITTELVVLNGTLTSTFVLNNGTPDAWTKRLAYNHIFPATEQYLKQVLIALWPTYSLDKYWPLMKDMATQEMTDLLHREPRLKQEWVQHLERDWSCEEVRSINSPKIIRDDDDLYRVFEIHRCQLWKTEADFRETTKCCFSILPLFVAVTQDGSLHEQQIDKADSYRFNPFYIETIRDFVSSQ
jgi:hypothetical protein